jgi:signal transduction histidine kinase
MKLRGRFTLTLALAGLVPIALAAVITTRVVASSYKERYQADRAASELKLQGELARLERGVIESAASLAAHDHPMVGGMLIDYAKGNGQLDGDALRRLREQSGGYLRGLALDVLTVTGPDDVIQVSAHYRAKVGDIDKQVRERATAHAGSAFYAFDTIMHGNGRTKESVLVVEAAQVSRAEGFTAALWVGRRVGDDVLAPLRTSAVDARIVSPEGNVLVPPASKNWAQLAKDAPIKKGLPGHDGKPVAYVEVAVSDGGLNDVLRQVTLTSAGLAIGALVVVILIGLLVARRTARDLDVLVEGSLAAARGDYDHRVPVRSKDEVGAVANAFNLMMEDLTTSKEKLVIAERIAAWQEIARRLAHEIKNPLTPIQMAMDTLRKSYKKQHPEFPEILEESTRTVLEEADRLKKIVAEFSDFARMPKPELHRIELNDVVRSALALYQGGATKVELTLAPDLPAIDGDKGQLTQVLLNLVENARDAIGARDDGRITVTTRKGDGNDRAMLVIEDNGPGVPLELKDKVFAPYFTTKHNKGGTGLGLAIVHRIVSDHGGRITITDASGGGARFSIELPLRSGAALLVSRADSVRR